MTESKDVMKALKPWFFCDVWHQQIAQRMCLNRYRKGMKKCQGCEIGRAIAVAEVSRIKAGMPI